MHSHGLVAGALVAFAGLSFGFTGTVVADGEGPKRYDGDVVVRVLLETEEQLAWMRELSDDCWSESPGLGLCDFRIGRAELDQLRLMPMPFIVTVDDVQAQLDAENARRAQGAAEGAGWFDDFKDFDAIVARLDQHVANHPDLVTKMDVGDSIEGRDIWAVRITAPGGGEKPGILYNGTQHAREWISPMTVMWIVENLVEGYGNEPRITALLDTIEFFVVPVVNPDGYVFSWTDERLWRKNRRDNGDGSIGVDPNRNWGFGWGGEGADDFGSGETYRGTGPFSEPETQAMRDLYIAHPNIVASIDFHSYGQDILYPFGGMTGGPQDDGEHEHVGQIMHDSIQSFYGLSYLVGSIYDDLYPASGGSVDWTWGDQGVISYTIELRNQSTFVLPPEEIEPTITENLEAALQLAEVTVGGVAYRFAGGLPDVIFADETTAIALTIEPVLAGDLNPATAMLHWRIGGAGPFADVPLVHEGGDDYTATLPAVPCGSTLEYWFEIDGLLSGTYVSPLGAPAAVHSAYAESFTFAFDDDFEGDLGWTVADEALTDGSWDRGVPAGGGDRWDPPTDYDGSGACYLTDNEDGNSDVDGGPTRLTSPVIDVTGLDDPRLAYARWFGNDDQDADTLDVELSNDGGATWTLVDSTGHSGGWVAVDLRVADYVAPTSTMVVRFSATDNPNDSVTEAAVDGVRFFVSGCEKNVPGDVDGDGLVDFADLLAALSAWGPCVACPEDLDGDGEVGFGDLLEILANWT